MEKFSKEELEIIKRFFNFQQLGELEEEDVLTEINCLSQEIWSIQEQLEELQELERKGHEYLKVLNKLRSLDELGTIKEEDVDADG